MYFDFKEEQKIFGQQVKKLLQKRGAIEITRNYMDGNESMADEVWEELADLGLFQLMIPQSYGGLEEGIISSVPVFEEIGKYLLPGPYAETLALGPLLLNLLEDHKKKEDLLQALGEGKLRIGFVPENAANQLSFTDEFILDGQVRVYGGKKLDLIILNLATGTDDHAVYCLVDPSVAGCIVQYLEPLDMTGSIGETTFNQVKMERGSIVRVSPKDHRHILNHYMISLSSMMLGAMDEIVRMSVDYANQRTQFGQPIGRFQAVKHRITDMKIELEIAKSLVYFAAWSLENADQTSDVAVDAAKSYASEAFTRLASNNIQIFGANGYTWEYTPHLYLKRAKVWENYWESPVNLRSRIADYLLS